MESIRGSHERQKGPPVLLKTGRIPGGLPVTCPHCERLYSADPAALFETQVDSRTPACFECVSCRTRFGVRLLEDASVDEGFRVKSFIAPLVQSIRGQPVPGRKVPLNRQTAREPVVGRSAHLVRSSSVNECPQCKAKNAIEAKECRSCGVVFEKYRSKEDRTDAIEELELAGRPELVMLWKEVIENYHDRSMHGKFVEACRASEALAYAARRYARILEVAPAEETALEMRDRVVGLAAHPFDRVTQTLRRLPVPGFSGMAIFLSSFVMSLGLFLDDRHSLTAIGGSMLVLSLGVRFSLRPFRR